MALTAENTINGSFGQLIWNEVEIGNVMSVEARAILDKRDLRLAGTRLTQYKAMSVRGEGTFTIYKVVSHFTDYIESMFSESRYLGVRNRNLGMDEGHEMKLILDDPEIVNNAGGTNFEQCTLESVKIWEIPIGFSVDELVQQALPFTFEGFKLNDEIDFSGNLAARSISGPSQEDG